MLTPLNSPISQILSFDGGPAALIQIRILRYIATKVPDVLEKVHLFAGVSVGAFAALFLASELGEGKPSLAAIERCESLLDDFIVTCKATWCDALRVLSGFGPLKTSAAERSVLERYMGSKTMGELTVPVLVASFNIRSWRPRLFTNFGEFAGLCRDRSLVDVTLASSAYPMLVNTHHMARASTLDLGGQFVDGAVMINNPTMTAVAVALTTQDKDNSSPEQGYFQGMSELYVLSLGATVAPIMRDSFQSRPLWTLSVREIMELARSGQLDDIARHPVAHDLYWGWLQWLIVHRMMYVNLTLQAPAAQVDYQCRKILGSDHYRRIAPPIDELFAAREILFRDPEEIIRTAAEIADEIIADRSGEIAQIIEWLRDTWEPSARAAPRAPRRKPRRR